MKQVPPGLPSGKRSVPFRSSQRRITSSRARISSEVNILKAGRAVSASGGIVAPAVLSAIAIIARDRRTWSGSSGSARSVRASEMRRLTALSCRQSDAAIRHRLSCSVMKIGDAESMRRGENTSAGTQSGVRAVSAISTAASPAAVV